MAIYIKVQSNTQKCFFNENCVKCSVIFSFHFNKIKTTVNFGAIGQKVLAMFSVSGRVHCIVIRGLFLLTLRSLSLRGLCLTPPAHGRKKWPSVTTTTAKYGSRGPMKMPIVVRSLNDKINAFFRKGHFSQNEIQTQKHFGIDFVLK